MTRTITRGLARRAPWAALAILLAATGWALAQQGASSPGSLSWQPAAARGTVERLDAEGYPTWDLDPEMGEDVFTFTRLRYSSHDGGWGRGRRGRGGGGWRTDYPDSDRNLSYRLHQITAMKVHPEGRVIDITAEELAEQPFVYMIEPGRLQFTEEEVVALRGYLLAGGFLMVDDFWGEREWENFHAELKRVFPDREPVDLELDHPLYSQVFPLKRKPQVPSIGAFMSGEMWERGEDGREVHIRAVFDDEGRMMVIICHNTDLGDGWEREGESHEYFKQLSEPLAYPMAINVLMYAMTH